ncbi:uncharacterized protein EV422DRAFT_166770 [Fimicolochytrium jonesii]|uniref:uncharacterized protein n=1 Tax=Fimicolochytrium jonesii TaxID=1396493 RepID=UPI0022FE2E9D|nr:uncharacterized protein EV422DRAFT_166770 [Fimicolochytrium jonesii]KAI8818826.1 hypothetical protein EV422DRAFT_166770 [Fimicolochytrium jonesii]
MSQATSLRMLQHKNRSQRRFLIHPFAAGYTAHSRKPIPSFAAFLENTGSPPTDHPPTPIDSGTQDSSPSPPSLRSARKHSLYDVKSSFYYSFPGPQQRRSTQHKLPRTIAKRRSRSLGGKIGKELYGDENGSEVFLLRKRSGVGRKSKTQKDLEVEHDHADVGDLWAKEGELDKERPSAAVTLQRSRTINPVTPYLFRKGSMRGLVYGAQRQHQQQVESRSSPKRRATTTSRIPQRSAAAAPSAEPVNKSDQNPVFEALRRKQPLTRKSPRNNLRIDTQLNTFNLPTPAEQKTPDERTPDTPIPTPSSVFPPTPTSLTASTAMLTQEQQSTRLTKGSLPPRLAPDLEQRYYIMAFRKLSTLRSSASRIVLINLIHYIRRVHPEIVSLHFTRPVDAPNPAASTATLAMTPDTPAPPQYQYQHSSTQSDTASYRHSYPSHTPYAQEQQQSSPYSYPYHTTSTSSLPPSPPHNTPPIPFRISIAKLMRSTPGPASQSMTAKRRNKRRLELRAAGMPVSWGASGLRVEVTDAEALESCRRQQALLQAQAELQAHSSHLSPGMHAHANLHTNPQTHTAGRISATFLRHGNLSQFEHLYESPSSVPQPPTPKQKRRWSRQPKPKPPPHSQHPAPSDIKPDSSSRRSQAQQHTAKPWRTTMWRRMRRLLGCGGGFYIHDGVSGSFVHVAAAAARSSQTCLTYRQG